MTTAPLLEAIDARVAVDGTVAIDRLTFTSQGDRLLVAGDAGALFAALTGVALGLRAATTVGLEGADDVPPSAEASVVAGSLKVDGVAVGERGYHAVIGAAALDPPMPPKWSAEEFVTWSARLGGASRRAAADLALAALAKVGLTPARKRPLAVLSLAERRALVLAQAISLGPAVLIAEAPMAGLEGAAAAFVLAAVSAATEGRRAILSAARIDPAAAEGVLVRGASHIVVLAAGEIAFDGTPAELMTRTPHYTLLVREGGGALRADLATRGIDLRGGPSRFSVALPAGASTRDLLLSARAVSATILELVPLVG